MAYKSCNTKNNSKVCYSKLIKCLKCGSIGCEMDNKSCINGLRISGRCKICNKGISMYDFKPIDL